MGIERYGVMGTGQMGLGNGRCRERAKISGNKTCLGNATVEVRLRCGIRGCSCWERVVVHMKREI